ncbi:hypothetical protein [Vibrio owensii]|uniref:hypothetical protein n=1 Tax=Vibrio owensii TaxID=696485 RepID=UPI0018F1364A|nr:hypothetical protein [Vibrio owensii]
MKAKYRALVLAVGVLAAMSAQANSDRFNSIKSGMSRTSSVTAQTQSTPNGGDFNAAVQDQDNKYGASFDDSSLKKADSDLQDNIDSLRSYVDSRDGSYYNSAKSYANSAASGAESRAKSHANTKASQAEANAKSYANSVASSRASTAESNAKSYASSRASTAETNARNYASSINSTTNSILRNEVARLEGLIDALDVSSGGGSGGGSATWQTVYSGAGTTRVSIPSKQFTHFRVQGTYRLGISHQGKFNAATTTYKREAGSSASPQQLKTDWCIPQSSQHLYEVKFNVPVPKAGAVLVAPGNMDSARTGSCSANGNTNSKSMLRDFKWTKVEILAP